MKRAPLKTEDFILFAEAWIDLAKARILLVFFSFKKVVRVMNAGVPNRQMNYDIDRSVAKISLAIARACRKSPWRTLCFEQALAATFMLHRRKLGTTIYFGVQKNDGKLVAHAWLDCESRRVTGGRNNDDFTVIASFSS